MFTSETQQVAGRSPRLTREVMHFGCQIAVSLSISLRADFSHQLAADVDHYLRCIERYPMAALGCQDMSPSARALRKLRIGPATGFARPFRGDYRQRQIAVVGVSLALHFRRALADRL